MPYQTQGNTHFRPDLGLALIEYDAAADEAGFVGQELLPAFEVEEQAAWFPRVPIEALLRDANVTRGTDGSYPRDDFEVEDDSYSTHDYGHEGRKDRREAKIYSRFFEFESIVAGRQRDFVLRAAEMRAANLLFNAANWHSTALPIPWSNHVDAVPIDDIFAARQLVWLRCGVWPDVLGMSEIAFFHLSNSAQLLERIASQGAGSSIKASDVTPALIAQTLKLRKVVVAGAPKNTANEAKPVNISSIWRDDYAFLGRVARSKNAMEPCVGRTIHWGEDGSQIGGTFEDYPEDKTRGDVIRCRHDVVEKIIQQEAGELLTNVVS